MTNLTKRAFWLHSPTSILMVIALNTFDDITGEASDKVMGPMRARWKDTDAKVAPFLADVNTIKRVVGGRDVILALRNIELKSRTDLTGQCALWLLLVKAVAADLVARKTADEAELVKLGMLLLELTDEAAEDMAYHDVLRLMPAATLTVSEHAALLVDNGLTQEELDRGVTLETAVTRQNGKGNSGLIKSKDATVDLDALMSRLVDFFTFWAGRREALRIATGRIPPGFDVSEAEQWAATRPSAIAARELARAEATPTVTNAPAPLPNGVIGQALEAFRAGTAPGGAA